MIKNFLRATIGIGGKHLAPLLRRVDSSLTIFVLHDVTDEPAPFTKQNDIWVSRELFRRQMEFVAGNFNVVSMEMVLRGDLPCRAAMITFDDGYSGIFENALPVLSDMRLPSTIFVNMSPVLGENYWAEKVFYLCDKVPTFLTFLQSHGFAEVGHPQLRCTQNVVDAYEQECGNGYLSDLQSYLSPYVTAEGLKEAADNPLLTLGSHLYTHYNVRYLTDQALDDQYHKNEADLTGFKNYLPVFAFPFGQPELCFTKHQASVLLRHGAAKLFTSWPRPNIDHSAEVLDRIGLTTWHDRDRRLWFQILRYPLAEIIGRTDPDWNHPHAEAIG